MKANRYGVIDIGTLKVKCQIVEKSALGDIVTVYQSNNLTCLGCHMEQNNNRPKDANLERTYTELSKCKNILKENKVKETRIVSTHALREMGPVGEEVAALIKKKVGLKVEIISAQEEAHLFFNAVFSDFKPHHEYVLADVGGGSVQVLIGSKNNLKQSYLLKTGTSSLWDKFTPDHQEMDYPSRDEIRQMKEYILAQIQPIPKAVNAPLVYGSSCIIDLFKGIGLTMQPYDQSPSHPFKVQVSDLADFLENVWSVPYDVREQKYISPTTRYMWGADKAFLNIIELANRVGAPYIIPSNSNINQGLLMSIVSK